MFLVVLEKTDATSFLKPAKVSYNAALNVCASNAEVENLGLKKGFFSGWIFRDSLGTYGTPLLYGNSMGPSCHTGVPGITLEICKASPLIFFGNIFEPKKITQLKRNIHLNQTSIFLG